MDKRIDRPPGCLGALSERGPFFGDDVKFGASKIGWSLVRCFDSDEPPLGRLVTMGGTYAVAEDAQSDRSKGCGASLLALDVYTSVYSHGSQ